MSLWIFFKPILGFTQVINTIESLWVYLSFIIYGFVLHPIYPGDLGGVAVECPDCPDMPKVEGMEGGLGSLRHRHSPLDTGKLHVYKL